MNNFINSLYRYARVGLATAGIALLVPSCGNDGPDIEPVEADGPLRFSFTIVTKTVNNSRAADLDGDKIGSAPENMLDVNDIRYLIFDADRNLVSDITPKASIVAENDAFTIYNVTAKLDEPYFVDKINSNNAANLEFYIMVLANFGDWGITLPPIQEGLPMQTLFTQGLVMNTLPNSAALLDADTGFPPTRQMFPMAGLQRFVINGNNLLNTTESEPYRLPKDIYMLRALSKIEVIDRVNIDDDAVFTNEDRLDPLRVDKVEINGFMNRGTLLPAIDQWNRQSTFETQQVIATTIPGDAEYLTPPTINLNDRENPFVGNSEGRPLLNFVYDQAATAARTDKCPVFSCYVFEYSSALLNATQQRPYLRITTQGGEDEDEPMASLVLPMLLADYGTNPPTPVSNLLRNHIYRYEIVGIYQDIRVNWTVCPMDDATINIGFN